MLPLPPIRTGHDSSKSSSFKPCASRAGPEPVDTPPVGKTYGLLPRTVRLIESLTSKFGTRGNVLAAVAGLLTEDLKAGKV